MKIYFYTLMFFMLLSALLILLLPLLRRQLLKVNAGVIVIVATFSGLSILLFQVSGQDKQYFDHLNQTAVVKQMQSLGMTANDVIRSMKKRLSDDPNSAKGWYLLGRLYFSLARYSQAEKAFAQSYALNTKDIATINQYAQSQYLAHDKKMTVSVKRLIQESLALTKDNPAAINLLAIDAYQQHRYKDAISQWRKILAMYPPKSQEAKQLMILIAKSQKQSSG